MYFIIFLFVVLFSTHVYAGTDSVCNREFPVTVGNDTLYQRYCGNVDITKTNTDITELQIFVHGLGLTSQHYTDDLVPAAKAAGKNDEIAIIAPQYIRAYTQGLPFVDEYDHPVGGTLDLNSTHSDNLYYGARWERGDESWWGSKQGWPRRPFRISSFQVMDMFLQAGVDNYPNLERIVVTGHSAGGQFVNRYVLAAVIPTGFPEKNVLFAPVNASSNVYFDDDRPDSPVEYPITFSTPTSSLCVGVSPPDPENFSDYNEYKYAFVDKNDDDACDNCRRESKYMGGRSYAEMLENFKRRNIMRMIGLDDNSPTQSSLNRGCASHLQGDNRLVRAEAYMEHIKNYHGWEKWADLQTLYVPGCGHSGPCVWTSTCGLYVLFGENAGSCADRDALTESFDDENLTGWSSSGVGTVARSGDQRAAGDYSAKFNGTTSNLTLTSPLVSGRGVYTVSWAWRIGSRLDRGERLTAEKSVDGGGWTEIETLNGDVDQGNEWAYAGFTEEISTSLQIRFIFNADSVEEEAFVDDVRIMKREGL